METLIWSLEEWGKLYTTAIEFKNTHCWDWMYDSDIFGVSNPENGKIGYCCVLGNTRELYGLAVYNGTNGLQGYYKLQSDEYLYDAISALNIQDCIMMSFVDRQDIAKEDRQIIKQLGLKLKGKDSYPQLGQAGSANAWQ